MGAALRWQQSGGSCGSSRRARLRTRDADDITLLLYCTSQPSIEKTRRLRLGCFQYFYFSLESQFKKARLAPLSNRWSEVYNFTPGHGAHILMELDEMDPARLLKPLHEHTSFTTSEELASWKRDSPVPMTIGAAKARSLLAEHGPPWTMSIILCSSDAMDDHSTDPLRRLRVRPSTVWNVGGWVPTHARPSRRGPGPARARRRKTTCSSCGGFSCASMGCSPPGVAESGTRCRPRENTPRGSRRTR